MIVDPGARQVPEALEDRPRHGATDRYRTAAFVAIVLAAIYLVVVIRAVASSSYDTWGGFVVAPFFFFAAAPILRRMLKKVEPDRWIRNVVMTGLFAKLIGAYARFYTNEYVIGRGDSVVYDRHGRAVAEEFRNFVFGGDAYQNSIPDLIGTEFIRFLVSIVYTVIGSTRIGGFVVFSFMSFWGLYLFYRAYSIAVPDGLRRRYVLLVFFLPSVVFWPSSVGKEAWMTTMLGLGAYGLARLLTRQRFAYPIIAAAVAGTGIVRPHVAAIYLVGLGAAFMLNRASGGAGKFKKILGLLFFAIVAGLLMRQLQTFFGLEEGLDAQAVFEKTADRSSQGGSRFEANQPTSLADLPWALVTVLFRPFIYEAGSAAGAVTALEGTLLLGLFIWNVPRLVRLPGMAIVRPYIGFVVAYSLVFVFAFSAISNFGILARQRTQLFPIVAVILTIPLEPRLRTRELLTQRADDRRRTAEAQRNQAEPGDSDQGDADQGDSGQGAVEPVAVGQAGAHRGSGIRQRQSVRGSPPTRLPPNHR